MGTRGTLIDETGKRYGMLVVLAQAPSRHGLACWRCLCDCGIERVCYGQMLRAGTTTSCGCASRPTPLEARVGEVHGRLTITAIEVVDGIPYATCDCACGTRGHRVSYRNFSGVRGTRSCGCLQRSDGMRLHQARILDRTDGYRARIDANSAAAYKRAVERFAPQAEPVVAPSNDATPCASCAVHPSVRAGLCDGCLHAVECHRASVEAAYEVECDGKCGRYRRAYEPTEE